ncbi:MAG: hypothetical protein NDJ18_11110 [candidate division Zixibacteria bacterium]|nr:hypothetical protein [candidate division Zixibacteria bacterium]
MSKAKKQLHVVSISSGKKGCKVSRPFLVTNPGDKVKFQNKTKGKVYLHISEDKIFKKGMFSVAKGKTLTQVTRRVNRGVYPYAVFCEEKAKFCTGSSMPIIIVPR